MLQKRHLPARELVLVVVFGGSWSAPDWGPGKGTSAMSGRRSRAVVRSGDTGSSASEVPRATVGGGRRGLAPLARSTLAAAPRCGFLLRACS